MVYQKSVQTLKTHSEGFQAFQPALTFHSQKVNFVKNIKTLKPQQFRLQKYHRQRRSHSSNITEKTSKDKKALPANVFVVQSVLDINDGKYLIKWKDFPENEATWESEKNIPKFIKLYYETPQNLGKNLPNS